MARFLPPVLTLLAIAAFAASGGAGRAASDHRTADGSETENPDLEPGRLDLIEAAADGPREDYAPFFTTEWSLGLRGSYVRNGQGERIDTIIAPAASWTHEGRRQNLAFEAEGEIVKPSNDTHRLAALRLSAAADYTFDQWTVMSAYGELDYSQEGAGDSGPASGILISPVIVSGEAGGEGSRTFGRFVLTGRGTVGRSVSGPTTLDDLSLEDNSADNVTYFGGGLRLGFELSPRATLFADIARDRQVFDLPSPTQLVKLDGTTTVLSAGATAQWGRFVDAEASVGVGVHQSDEPSLPDVASLVYAARLSYTPDETFTLVGEFGTSLGPAGSDSAGAASLTYEASASARYVVNDWLALRAAADWATSSSAGTTETETGYGFGVGLDYLVNAHATLSADYGFGRTESSTDPAEDTHRVTFGLVLSN